MEIGPATAPALNGGKIHRKGSDDKKFTLARYRMKAPAREILEVQYHQAGGFLLCSIR